MRSRFVRLFLAVGVCASTALAQQTVPHANSNGIKMSTVEEAVWEKEEAYWHIVKANDREAWARLWHERFVGWPRGESQPFHKNQSFGSLEGRKLLDYKLEPLSVQEYGQGVVITFYRATVHSTNEAGTDEHSIASRITHTWMKTPQGWQIIGGMSAEDKPSGLPIAVGTGLVELKGQGTASQGSAYVQHRSGQWLSPCGLPRSTRSVAEHLMATKIPAATASIHKDEAELYFVIEGSATLVTERTSDQSSQKSQILSD